MVIVSMIHVKKSEDTAIATIKHSTLRGAPPACTSTGTPELVVVVGRARK